MNNRRCVLILFFFICITALLPAFGRNEVKTVQVTGVVRLIGTSLFPEIVVTGSDMEWHIAKDEINKLFDLQHRTVTVEGQETVTELRFANGLPAGTRRELRNIRIVTVSNN